MFSREFRRPKTAKVNIYLILRVAGLPVWLSICGGGGVHWVQVVGRASRFQDLPEVGSGPLVVRSVPFVRFVALRLARCSQICLYLRFKGVFSGFCGADVYLYRLGALR